MSLEATKWAWRQRDLSPRARLLLLALADCCNHKTAPNVCWPSLTCLQRMTELSRSSVCRALDELASREGPLISRGTGGGAKSTTYTLAFEPEETPRGGDGSASRTATTNGGAAPVTSPRLTSPQPPDETTGSPRVVLPQSQDETTGSPRVALPQSQDETTGGPRMTPGWSQRDTGVVPGWDGGGPRVTPGTRNRTGKRTGNERGPRERPGTKSRTRPETIQPGALSLAPDLFDWQGIGQELRPEIDSPGVWGKFCAYHHGETKTAADWERDWRLWVMRERAPPAQTRRERPARAVGDFLTDREPSLTADYEVIRES